MKQYDKFARCLITDGFIKIIGDAQSPEQIDKPNKIKLISKNLKGWQDYDHILMLEYDDYKVTTMARLKKPTFEFILNEEENDYGEYVIEVYKNGERYPDADYFAADIEDARGTLQVMVEQHK